MPLTADLHALVEAVLAVVLSVAEPLLGDALVLGAGELVPQARRVCREPARESEKFQRHKSNKVSGETTNVAHPIEEAERF